MNKTSLFKKVIIIILFFLLFVSFMFINNNYHFSSNQAISNLTLPTIDEHFKQYSTYQPTLSDEYLRVYKLNNNIIYSLNKVNQPNFLDLNEPLKPALLLDNLLLVNPVYYLEENYQPSSLEKVSNVLYIKRTNEIMRLDKDTYLAYQAMFNDALTYNIELVIYSGYRSFTKQAILYKNNTNPMLVALPGHSEHQTGYAIDIGTYQDGLINDENVVYEYLDKYAYLYGFILRYPENKEHITGYLYEPWHYRYVGKNIAKIMYEQKITLEEYFYYYIELK